VGVGVVGFECGSVGAGGGDEEEECCFVELMGGGRMKAATAFGWARGYLMVSTRLDTSLLAC